MRTNFLAPVLCLTLTAGFWYCLNSSLGQMTATDCRAGVQRACKALR